VTAPVGLLNVPRDDHDFDRYSFDLNTQINEINQAIAQQKKIALPTIQLYPIPLNDLGNYLQRVQQSVSAFTEILGLQNVDVEAVDLRDERQRQAWCFSIYEEVYGARAALKI
jgi:hypothetical protein